MLRGMSWLLIKNGQMDDVLTNAQKEIELAK